MNFFHSSLRPTSSSSSSSTSSSSSNTSSRTNTSICFGVDWSERARPTSHCWFPFKLHDATSSQICAFFSCKDPKSTNSMEFVRCESCSVVVHMHHLINLPLTSTTTNYIPPCRPSFSESNQQDRMDQNKADRHYWSHVSILTKPCVLCRRKSMSSSIFGTGRPSTMPTMDAKNRNSNNKNSLTSSSSPKMAGTSSGYQCLWCSRSYHRRCWDRVADQDEKNKCDYGALRYEQINVVILMGSLSFV